jgi:hypothetical protein
LSQEETNDADKDKKETNILPIAGNTLARRKASYDRYNGICGHIALNIGKRVTCYLFHVTTS